MIAQSDNRRFFHQVTILTDHLPKTYAGKKSIAETASFLRIAFQAAFAEESRDRFSGAAMEELARPVSIRFTEPALL